MTDTKTANDTGNGIRHEQTRGELTLDRIYKSDFQKPGTMTAQIRQVVTTNSFYPSKKTSSDLQSNIFGNKDFGFDEQKFTSTETRIAWILVPANIAEDVVKAKLAEAHKAGACLYRVLSNSPILDENQKYGVAQKLTTMDNFANSQAVRFPEGHESAGKLTLDKEGKVQYRRTFFWNEKKEDMDARGNEVYLSPELKAELEGASALQNQKV